jgi:hypothetical protein
MPINDDDTLDDDDSQGDDEPTKEELDQIRRATSADAAAVDALILGKCSSQWSKVATIVGSLLDEFEERFPYLPYVYMPIRMLELEARGLIAIHGDALAIRSAEVRLCGATNVVE